MSSPKDLKDHIDRFGSEDAKLLATVVTLNTDPLSMGQHDGMEALKRLSDLELEVRVLDLLIAEGYKVSKRMGESRAMLSIQSPDGSVVISNSRTAEVVRGIAAIFIQDWSPELKDKVILYLVSNDFPVERIKKKGGPLTKLDESKRR
jgi:hypothetical protein